MKDIMRDGAWITIELLHIYIYICICICVHISIYNIYIYTCSNTEMHAPTSPSQVPVTLYHLRIRSGSLPSDLEGPLEAAVPSVFFAEPAGLGGTKPLVSQCVQLTS